MDQPDLTHAHQYFDLKVNCTAHYLRRRVCEYGVFLA